MILVVTGYWEGKHPKSYSKSKKGTYHSELRKQLLPHPMGFESQYPPEAKTDPQ